MRIIAGLVLAAVTATGALSADLRARVYYEPDGAIYADEVVAYAPRRVVEVRHGICGDCRRSRLPFGGLHRTYEAGLPYGGLWKYCPPALEVREVVLRRKG